MRFIGSLLSKLKVRKTSLSAPSEYKCQYCKETFPLNKDHFQVVRGFKYGYSTVCLECNKPKPKE